MKRNIISSKVEPQNTEDLWLNLVDGNIYSYEYGTWTNVNNVPNRVFNLDIDYTEENLTKFLSPLYEEGFSDDDFPKKVWDKYCETNPEFKLQGERENIRINVSLRDSKIFLKPVIDDYIVGYIDTSEVIDWPSMSSNQTFASILELDLTIGDHGRIYNIDPNGAFIGSYIGMHDEIIGEAYDAYKLDLAKLFSALGRDFDPNKKYTVIHTAGHGNTNSSGDVNSFGLPVYDMVVGKDNIASADIKLKQAHASSSIVYSNEGNMSIIGYGIEYISGLVTNKLDNKKMWEYLGEDIKYLIPARIDLVLPYDMSLYESFPNIVNNADIYTLFLSDLETFLYCGLNKHFLSPNSDLDPYLTYANLCSPIKLGLYKNRVNKKGTPIIDAKDKDKTDIVKLASQEISLMKVWEIELGTNTMHPYITEVVYPGEVTPEFFKELEKEGWEVSY